MARGRVCVCVDRRMKSGRGGGCGGWRGGVCTCVLSFLYLFKVCSQWVTLWPRFVAPGPLLTDGASTKRWSSAIHLDPLNSQGGMAVSTVAVHAQASSVARCDVTPPPPPPPTVPLSLSLSCRLSLFCLFLLHVTHFVTRYTPPPPPLPHPSLSVPLSLSLSCRLSLFCLFLLHFTRYTPPPPPPPLSLSLSRLVVRQVFDWT